MITYSLDSIVREFLVMQGRNDLNNYDRALQAAIRTLKDLHYDVSGVPKVEVIDVASTKGEIPQDFIKLIRMGFIDSAGKFVEIYVNNEIVTGVTETVQANNSPAPSFLSASDLAPMVRNGRVLGRWYGNAGGGVYSYRLDLNAGVIEFSSNVSGQVIMEYLSDPTKVGAGYEVHPFLIDAIHAGIYYRMIALKPNVPRIEKREAHTTYLNAKHYAKVRFLTESIGNMINTSRKTLSQTAKY